MALKLLEGMKVIEIAAFMAAPMGGRILGEWGADVIKVEPPTGDSNRGIGLARHIYNGDQAGWDSINSCKRCITLDTRKPEGLAILKEDAEGLRRVPLASATEGFQEAGSGLREPVEDQPKIIAATPPATAPRASGPPRGGVRRGLLRRACRLRLGLPHQGRQPDDPVLRLRRHPHGHLSGHGRAGRLHRAAAHRQGSGSERGPHARRHVERGRPHRDRRLRRRVPHGSELRAAPGPSVHVLRREGHRPDGPAVAQFLA